MSSSHLLVLPSCFHLHSMVTEKTKLHGRAQMAASSWRQHSRVPVVSIQHHPMKLPMGKVQGAGLEVVALLERCWRGAASLSLLPVSQHSCSDHCPAAFGDLRGHVAHISLHAVTRVGWHCLSSGPQPPRGAQGCAKITPRSFGLVFLQQAALPVTVHVLLHQSSVFAALYKPR